MVWLLKKIIKIIIILAIFGLIAGLVMFFFINPNDFRSQVNTALQEYTGQHLEVKGSIKWSLRPKAKLQLEDVVLSKMSDETIPLLKIKQASVDFDGFSYFTKNLVITNLELNDVAVDWDLVKALTKDNPKYNSIIKSLTIKNVSVLNLNERETQTWQLKNSILTADNLSINSGAEMTPIKLRGDLVNASTNTTLNIDAMLKVNATKHILTLDPLTISWNELPITGNAVITRYENDINIAGLLALSETQLDKVLRKLDRSFATNEEPQNINGQVSYTYQVKNELLDLTDIQIHLGNGSLNGNIKTSFMSPYQFEFALAADNIDFTQFLLLNNEILPKTANGNLIPVDLIKDLTVNGKFTGNNLSVNKNLKIDKINFTVVGQNGVLQLNPVTIAASGETHNLTLNLDVVKKGQPFFQLTEQAENVALASWLSLIDQNNTLSGTARIKASMEAIGNDTAMLKQSLTGSINMYVSDGVLYGIDASGLMSFTTKALNDIFNQMSKSPNIDVRALATSKSSDWTNLQQDNPNTKFDHFELKADLEQGISKKASIAMDNSDIELKATGGFSLKDNSLNFNGTLVSKKDVVVDAGFLADYMKKTALPIFITGVMQKPIFGPNIQEYAVSILSIAKTDILNQAITKMVSVSPPNIKTSKTATELFLDSLQSLSSK